MLGATLNSEINQEKKKKAQNCVTILNHEEPAPDRLCKRPLFPVWELKQEGRACCDLSQGHESAGDSGCLLLCAHPSMTLKGP